MNSCNDAGSSQTHSHDKVLSLKRNPDEISSFDSDEACDVDFDERETFINKINRDPLTRRIIQHHKHQSKIEQKLML